MNVNGILIRNLCLYTWLTYWSWNLCLYTHTHTLIVMILSFQQELFMIRPIFNTSDLHTLFNLGINVLSFTSDPTLLSILTPFLENPCWAGPFHDTSNSEVWTNLQYEHASWQKTYLPLRSADSKAETPISVSNLPSNLTTTN